jgi:hypothetical protein
MQQMLSGEKIKATAFSVVMFKSKGMNGSKEGGRQGANFSELEWVSKK